MKAAYIFLRFSFFVIALFSCHCIHSNKNFTVGGLIKTKKNPFSDKAKEDLFRIEAIGNKTDNMQLVFTITSFENKQIFKQKINVKKLLNSYLGSQDLNEEIEKQKFIKQEIDSFLNDDNFLEPAITENEKPDKYAPDLAFYNELKQTKLNGFFYRLGKETKIYIAWSVNQHKVKIYYKCC